MTSMLCEPNSALSPAFTNAPVSDQASDHRLLIVDDDAQSRLLLQRLMEQMATISLAGSGVEALAKISECDPDLILLDVEMPGLNGFSTCKKIREFSGIPVIFVTADQSLETLLEAFDVGGNDVITKPIRSDVLLRKAKVAIRNHLENQRISAEKRSFQTMAMNFLSTVGESSVLLNYFRDSVSSRTYSALADKLVDAARDLGLQSFGVIRHPAGELYFRTDGEPSHLERSVLAQLAGMGRVFQFKNQLVVNYDRVSIIVKNLPEDAPERIGRIRDNVAILAETTEALCETVQMRQESMDRAEQLQVALMGAVSAVESLREKHNSVLTDTRLLQQELIDTVERTYSWLGTTQIQEKEISDAMYLSVNRTLNLLATQGRFDEDFDHVLNALRGRQSQGEAELW